MESSYEKVTYTVAINVTMPPHDIFNHLLYDVAKFWPEDFAGASSQLNDEFTFTSGDSHYSKSRIVELIPDEKVVWLVIKSIRKTDGFDWTGTRMTFELAPEGKDTRLKYTYDGPVLTKEHDRLIDICDMVIKDRLYNFLTGNLTK